MAYGPKGKLHVGWSDSAVATNVDPRRKRGRIKQFKGSGPVMAISPNGRLAVTQLKGATPGRVFRVRDARSVVELNQLGTLGSARFSQDGKKLFVAQSDGRIHVWRQAQDLELLLSKRTKVQEYVARQNAHYNMNFGLPAFIMLDHGKDLVFGTQQGKLYYWSAATPGEADIALHLVPPIRSVVRQQDALFGTSSDGHLRGYSFKRDGLVPWTKQARAAWVAAGQKHSKHVATVGEVKPVLAWRDSATGKIKWKKDISALGKNHCGLSVDPKGKHIAMCVDQVIHIHRTKDGKRTRVIRRQGKKLRWK